MALNSSGPISLGGSTVGQSVNLELGQAATALTSLNATNVRTLLQVPSGQISLSNAYGKSNATAFIVSLGLQNTGSSSNTSVPIRGYGWGCSPSGVTAWKMGAFMYVGYMSADGTSFTSVQIQASGTPSITLGPTVNKYTAAAFFVTANGQNSKLTNFSSSNSYSPALSSVQFGTGASVGTPPLATHIDSSGNVTWLINANEDKYGGYLFCGRNNSSGTNLSVYTTSVYSSLPYDNIRRVIQKSDGTWIVAFGQSDNTTWRTYNSNFSTNTGRFNTSVATGQYVLGLDIDSNNNLFSYYKNGTVLKISSSNTVTAAYNYSVLADGYASSFGRSGAFGMSIYNDVMYIATNGAQDGSVSATGYYLNIIAISCSSMTTVLWNRQFYFNSNEIRPMSTYTSNFNPGQCNGIQATSAGLYVAFTVGTGVSGEVFCMNLPLTVGISNQTTSIAFKSGGSVTMTVTTPSNATNNVSIPSVTTNAGHTMVVASQQTATVGTTSYYTGLGGTKTTITV